ncbi:MAG TPA: neuraminidase-like domain-containing protein, partial [Terrimicrobiaceae bacterium]
MIAAHEDIEDSSDLYERYLIDVEMSACMNTSRIKQAISSVQLFVQRCLMNLGPDAQISEASAEQWQWMKNYRVWEANRKIFLYPENWILPELRDDKSPFFEELENQLLQNEVTEQTAGNALVSYLGKLDEVANLDVRALYHQKEEGEFPIDILHVVARTHATPHVYYYRRFVEGAYWTAWTQVNIDIDGDHLLAVVWNRRLYLMWPMFSDAELGSESCGSVLELIGAAFPELKADPIIRLWEDFVEFFEGYEIAQQLETILDAEEVNVTVDFDPVITDIQQQLSFLLKKPIEEPTVRKIVTDWARCRLSGGKVLMIGLAWTVYREGAWTAKKVTEETLTVPFRNKEPIFLKPDMTQTQIVSDTIPNTPTRIVSAFSTGELIVRCYSSRPDSVVAHGFFRFTGRNGRVVVTAYADELVSSTHLFDASISLRDMQFVEDEGVEVSLILPSSTVDSVGNWTGSLDIENLPVLNRTPGQFTLAVPHQYNEYVSQ